jgi:rubrerythrin
MDRSILEVEVRMRKKDIIKRIEENIRESIRHEKKFEALLNHLGLKQATGFPCYRFIDKDAVIEGSHTR